jgi:hypothetical protein
MPPPPPTLTEPNEPGGGIKKGIDTVFNENTHDTTVTTNVSSAAMAPPQVKQMGALQAAELPTNTLPLTSSKPPTALTAPPVGAELFLNEHERRAKLLLVDAMAPPAEVGLLQFWNERLDKETVELTMLKTGPAFPATMQSKVVLAAPNTNSEDTDDTMMDVSLNVAAAR